ncbi:MAG: hypothetical protein Q8R44_02060 [Novosphingobium sp.]|nr:hypothetical protein [Novosphingobium sp.]
MFRRDLNGSPPSTRWTEAEGQARYGCEIIAEQVDFLAKAKEATKDEPKKGRAK